MKDKVIELYNSGLGGPTIAKQLGIKLWKVFDYLKDTPKPNGGRQAKTNVEEIKKLYIEDKLSCQQIADKLGLTDSGTVWNRLKNAGVKLRSKSEGMNLRGCRKIGSDQEIISLYKSGESQVKVAEKYDVYIGSIARILNKYEVNEGIAGARNPAWKGGTTEIIKTLRKETQNKLREKIFQLRNFTCEITDIKGGDLNVHHIVEFNFLVNKFYTEKNPDENNRKEFYNLVNNYKPFWDESNLLLLQEQLHKDIHANKKLNINFDKFQIKKIHTSETKLLLERFHYLRRAPSNTGLWYGLFINNSLVGVCGFGRGANQYLSKSVGGNALELTRLCIADFMPKNTGTYFLSKVIKQFRKDRPDIKFLVSYADPDVGHQGTIYKAANWLFKGQCKKDYKYRLPDGTIVHKSKFRCKNGKNEKQLAEEALAEKIEVPGKLKYIYKL